MQNLHIRKICVYANLGHVYTALFMSHICRIVQIAETSLRCVCERLRRVGDGFANYAMTWRGFCDDFCRTKKYCMFKTLANRSRRVRDACEDFAIPCERFATVRDGLSNRFANPLAKSSHPSEIGAISAYIFTVAFFGLPVLNAFHFRTSKAYNFLIC